MMMLETLKYIVAIVSAITGLIKLTQVVMEFITYLKDKKK